MKKQRPKIKTVDRYERYSETEELYSSKRRNLTLLVPSNFRMLCAILEIKPEEVLHDFMWLVSYSYSEPANEKQRKAAKKFFLEGRFGQQACSQKEINRMFKELKALRTICDTTESIDVDDRELHWQGHHMHAQHWFKRWFGKIRHSEDVSLLAGY